MTLKDDILAKRLIVCCGSGGVGKTTTSAAIALEAARLGKRTLVITIDPAKRLAQSLGLESLDDTEREVPLTKLAAGRAAGGSLHAAMLDTQVSLDALIDRIAAGPEQAARIKANKIYRQFTSAIAGSQEYVAMERLHQIMQEGRFDLVVLDTPPTKNALDFLNAPNRLAAFLDENVIKWFVRPPKSGMGSFIFQKGGEVAYKLLALLVGEQLIADLADFFQAFAGLYSGFAERAQKVDALLRDPGTVFLLITSAEHNALAEAVYFHNRLVESRITIRAVIVNRAWDILAETPITGEALARMFNEETIAPLVADSPGGRAAAHRLKNKLAALHTLIQDVNTAARENIERLQHTLGAAQNVACVPAFAEEIYDIQGLMKMNGYLFAGERG
ncbi:MAG: ArsA family ATPase [Myxococcales bacterium]|nr:MAG: ArsA family ATPase [Myxococcales bacterium]